MHHTHLVEISSFFFRIQKRELPLFRKTKGLQMFCIDSAKLFYCDNCRKSFYITAKFRIGNPLDGFYPNGKHEGSVYERGMERLKNRNREWYSRKLCTSCDQFYIQFEKKEVLRVVERLGHCDVCHNRIEAASGRPMTSKHKANHFIDRTNQDHYYQFSDEGRIWVESLYCPKHKRSWAILKRRDANAPKVAREMERDRRQRANQLARDAVAEVGIEPTLPYPDEV